MNFEDKVLALFDNGRRSAVYVAGYQSARAQAASIAAEADRLIAEMAVENAELRELLAAKVAEQNAAVEALDIAEIRELLLILRRKIGGALWSLEDEEEELAVRVEKAMAALAARRKQGGE